MMGDTERQRPSPFGLGLLDKGLLGSPAARGHFVGQVQPWTEALQGALQQHKQQHGQAF